MRARCCLRTRAPSTRAWPPRRPTSTAFGNGDSGPLSVGTYQSVGARVLPTLLAAFRAEWPKVDVRLVESADDRELLELVERGDIDLSFCVFPLEGGPFESVELMRDPYVLVVAARLAARRAARRRRRSARSSTCR